MPGQMVHLEIPAGDTEKAREFWGSLFGWQWQEFEGSPSEYHMTQFSDRRGDLRARAGLEARDARVLRRGRHQRREYTRAGARRRGRRRAAGARHGLVLDLQGQRGERVRALADRPERIHARVGAEDRRAGGDVERRLHVAFSSAI